jgi:hypothetical protein
MTIVGEVQVAIDEIAGVVTMGDGLVAAAGAVDMGSIVGSTGVAAGAGVRIGGRNFEGAFVEVAVVGFVEMAVVEIVGMVAVLDGQVAAIRTVDVIVVFVNVMLGLHGVLLSKQVVSWARLFRWNGRAR